MTFRLVDNLKQQFNTINLIYKIRCSELLLLLQREAFFRDALYEVKYLDCPRCASVTKTIENS
jgi:hypothetical protein